MKKMIFLFHKEKIGEYKNMRKNDLCLVIEDADPQNHEVLIPEISIYLNKRCWYDVSSLSCPYLAFSLSLCSQIENVLLTL